MSRVLGQWIARVMVGVLLFAQIAVSAHACPAMDMAPSEADSSAVSMSTPCPSEQMKASPALCFAHCEYGQQSADHASAPVVQAALLTALYSLPPLALSSGHTRPSFDQPSPQAAASPPLAILHCCLRI